MPSHPQVAAFQSLLVEAHSAAKRAMASGDVRDLAVSERFVESALQQLVYMERGVVASDADVDLCYLALEAVEGRVRQIREETRGR